MTQPPPSPRRASRVSLSKSQQETDAGMALLALCQTVTADGVLSDQEIIDLRMWLTENREAGLPAIGFLIETVERILADKKVTREEREELHQAIEKVLPPDLRVLAKSRRREVESAQAELERSKSERFDFIVAGVNHEGRDRIVEREVSAGDTVFLVRDRANGFDVNAVEVRTAKGYVIGFVPSELAEEVAPLLDDGWVHSAFVKKIWEGRDEVQRPVVVADLYARDVAPDGAVGEDAVPASRLYFSSEVKTRIGCMVALLVVIVWVAVKIFS